MVLASTKPKYSFRSDARVPVWGLQEPCEASFVAGVDGSLRPPGPLQLPPGYAGVSIYRRSVTPLRRWLMRVPAEADADADADADAGSSSQGFTSASLSQRQGSVTAQVAVANGLHETSHETTAGSGLPPGVRPDDVLLGTAYVDLTRLSKMGVVRGWYRLVAPDAEPNGMSAATASRG